MGTRGGWEQRLNPGRLPVPFLLRGAPLFFLHNVSRPLGTRGQACGPHSGGTGQESLSRAHAIHLPLATRPGCQREFWKGERRPSPPQLGPHPVGQVVCVVAGRVFAPAFSARPECAECGR